MTVMLSATPKIPARLGLAASLLGVGLLLGFVPPSSTGEITPLRVPAAQSQVQSASQSESGTTPALSRPVTHTLPQLGTVGFGWG